MNKFEQLIEYVINDESEKARELFHDIVVEKSRTIYEEMMEAEEAEEESVEEAMEEEEESIEEGFGDNDLMGDIETEEQGVNMEDDEMGDEFGGAEDDGFADDMGGEGGEEDLEDRVVDLEDKLDELMAEFEQLMGGEAEEEEHSDMDFGDDELGGDASDEFANDIEVSNDGMSDEETQDDELETEGFMEAINLKAAPTPQRTEGDGINKKAVYAANSGAKGAMAKPVKTGTSEGGHHDTPAYKNTTKDLIGKVQNTPAQSTVKQSPAKKPNLGQAAGVNTKSVIQ